MFAFLMGMYLNLTRKMFRYLCDRFLLETKSSPPAWNIVRLHFPLKESFISADYELPKRLLPYLYSNCSFEDLSCNSRYYIYLSLPWTQIPIKSILPKNLINEVSVNPS